MAEYIERETLLAAYDKAHKGPPGGARKLIAEAPAADVAPVVHGRWNCVGQVCIDGEYEDTFRCSKCSIPYFRKSRYCPNCGARMDGK